MLMQSVALTHQPFDPVPHNAVPYLFTDRYSDSVPIAVVAHDINDQIFVGIGFPELIARPEIIIFLNGFHGSP